MGAPSEDAGDATPRPSSAVVGPASVVALVLTLVALAWLRRHPELTTATYDYGNFLSTHAAGGLTLATFEQGLVHLEFALLVGLLIACAYHLPRGRLATAVGSTACFVVVYADSVARYTTVIAGRLYLCMCDDALISMRYARNFAEGRGLVYNANEWVDGFSNPLWTAIMIVPHRLGMHEGVTAVPVVALGGALLIATAFVARVALADAGVSTALQLVAGLAMVFDASLFEFSVVGLETPLLGMASALVMAGGLCRREAWVLAGITILTLARADGAVVAGFLLGWLVLEERATSGDRLVVVARRHGKRFGVLAGIAGALVGWRLAVYGHPAPNTYYLKLFSLVPRITAGLASYGVRGIVMYGLPVAFVLWAAAVDSRARRARRMLLPVLGVWLYAIYVGGDAFLYMRFVGPVTPLLWTAVAMAAAAGWSERTHGVNGLLVALVALVAPVASERGILGSAWDRSGWIRDVVSAAKTVAKNVPAEDTVATFYAGMPYYAPSHRFLDVLGKTDSHIAHGNEIHGGVPGHNKFDFAYVYEERRPAVTFTAHTCEDVDRALAGPLEPEDGNPFGHGYQAPTSQLRDPSFRELYYPQRVVLQDGDQPARHPIGCWFIRKDANVPRFWQAAYE